MANLTQGQQIRLTPTARLSRRLAQQQALAAQSAGSKAWLPPHIYSFPAWLTALRHEYFLTSDDLRTPIDAQQALQLWRMPIDENVFIGTARVAELAQQAWRLIHEHQLDQPPQWPALLMSEDNQRFQEWAQRYQQICEEQDLVDEWSFAAELPEHIKAGAINVPDSIALDGFELALTPLQHNILQAFEAAGSKIQRPDDQPTAATVPLPQVQQFTLASQELTAAATWARGLLEANTNPEQSIAIVVPDLNGRLDAVERTLREVFNPGNFTLQEDNPEPWHISLGKPLSDWPLVQTAIRILQQNNNRFSQPQIAELVRSPFLPGWDQDQPARVQLLVHLAQNAPYLLTGNELLRALHPTDTDIEEEGALAQHLRAWRLERRGFQESAAPSQWAANFQQELSSIGFGQGRSLNSPEYQALQRWHSLLEDFSRLDLVSRAPMSRSEAIDAIQERAAKTVFRERNAGAPIEVLGVAEALGSTFDGIWITTLDSNTWPGTLGRDPLVPGPLQAQVPRATSDGCLAAAQAELRGLLNCAPVIQASYAQGTEEIPVQVAGLLGPLEIIERPEAAAAAIAPMETIAEDAAAPELLGTKVKVKGGTGVLGDQSDCPFRAFAKRRLGAVDTTPPRPGLDAMQRGILVHKALEIFWCNLSGSAELMALSEQARQQQVSEAVKQALSVFKEKYLLKLDGSAEMIEQDCIEKILLRWLEIEQTRSEFLVQEREYQQKLNIGPLELDGTIDRIDQLSDGSTLLIDYKTGRTARAKWLPEPRIKDPQLPLYALTMDPQPSAITFARLKPDDMKFDGMSDGDTGIEGITSVDKVGSKFKDLNEWTELLDGWQDNLQNLALEFKAGQAAVDPRDAQACKYCHLKALCRVYERDPNLADNVAELTEPNDDE